MGIRDRLRRLEDRFRDRGPTLEVVQETWARITESARAKLQRKGVDELQVSRDHDIVDKWARAERIDLDTEALRAKEKLQAMVLKRD